MTSWTPSRWGVGVAVVIACASVLAACAGGEAPPTRLVDGSPAGTSTIGFEGVSVPALVTLARRGRTAPRCGLDVARDATLVDRIGVRGASVTVRSGRARTVQACDATKSGSWCGQAFAHTRPGRTLEPRLSLTCTAADGSRVGFAWIEPGPKAAYVVVTHDRYAEVYRVLADASVRVSTDDVDISTSTARFDVSEHTGDGRMLDAYRIVARVAG